MKKVVLAILVTLLLSSQCFAAHLFAIVKETVPGEPAVDFTLTPVAGRCHAASAGNYGCYLFSGTGPQLTALNALANVIGICAMTQTGDVKWAELDTIPAAAIRNKLNTYLTNAGQPTIPASWTARQIVNAIFKRLNAKFEMDSFYVTD